MNVGIILRTRNPNEGGGYTISYDIIYSLLKKKNLIKHKLFFIIINDKSKSFEKLLKKKKLKHIIFKENYIFWKLKNFFFSKYKFLLEIYNYLGFNKLENIIKQNKLDVIWPISSELTFPYSKPYFFTVWDLQHKTISNYNEVGSFFTRIYRDIIFKANFKYSSFIISGTKTGKREIIKFYGVDKKKIYLNNHPTPKWAFQKIKKRKKLVKKLKLKNYFIYPANFWSHKNHLNLLKGFNLFIKKQNKEFQLVLVGNTVDKKVYLELIEYIKKNNLEKNIKILGFVKREELLELYDNAIALTYLSVSGPENLPPLEIFARGKPVINSKFEGAKEQLLRYPIYVDPLNPINIALGLKKIIKLNYNPKKYIKFAKLKETEKYIKKINSVIEFHEKN